MCKYISNTLIHFSNLFLPRAKYVIRFGIKGQNCVDKDGVVVMKLKVCKNYI